VKKKTVFLIAAGVVAAHAVGFYLISAASPFSRPPAAEPPNFSLGWAKFTDPATHEKMVYQEFTVSTRVEKPASGTAATPAPATPAISRP
jgi:hypothetical protein